MFDDGAWLLTCRHTYEETLIAELARGGHFGQRVMPALVAVPPGEPELTALDPVYAMQVLPEVRLAEGRSVRQLAAAVADVLAGPIDGVEGPWDLHVLVPAQLKGNPKPPMARRAGLLQEAIAERLGRIRKRAWRRRVAGARQPVLLGQVLLLSAERAVVSCAPTSATEVGGTWPSGLPAGLADVADDDGAPASSFRKLEEALACMGRWPQRGEHAVDAGACPGGWTRVMRRYGASVDAVDRQPLVRHLMRDRRVRFHKADVFTFTPERRADWWVSDVVAYPERIAGMVARVATEIRPTVAVIQVKFRREPDFDAIDAALATFRDAGYGARARHFFNDKNEVTLMAVRGDAPPVPEESA